MTIIDIVILVALGVGTVIGFMKGGVRQLASLIGLLVGLFVARALYPRVAEWIAPAIGTSMTVACVIGFFMIWIAIPLLFSVLGSFLTQALNAIHLGCINRWMGAALGAIKYFLVIGMFIQLIQFVDPTNKLISETTQKESVLYTPIYDITSLFIPEIGRAHV